ncbi:MAG: DUF3604 domain-containing protein, partial [Clostridia bacterium]|nr:DUF3604 domain-containing protein [Clostridia bacterium]
HCNISYGFGDLRNALEAAKGHLDFCAVTGHAHWPDIYKRNKDTGFIIDYHRDGFGKLSKNWDKVTGEIAKANIPGEFVTFQSYEMHSSKFGDHHFISPDDGFNLNAGDSPAQVVKSHSTDVMAIPHHIAYTPGYRGINWDNFDGNISPVVEVYSKHGCGVSEESANEYLHTMGPRDGRNTVYAGLLKGKKFGFAASTDHHAGYPGSYGDGITAVLADNLSRESIWEAIKKRRVYALTGDRIRCIFTVNGRPMGSEIQEGIADVVLGTETVGFIDKAVIYKNLKPIKSIYSENLPYDLNDGKYKIRIETGWGRKTTPFRWRNMLTIKNGAILSADPCFRGQSVLAPKEGKEYPGDVNKLGNRISARGETQLSWECTTFKNPTTRHSATCAMVVEIEGSPETCLDIRLNDKDISVTIDELLKHGISGHLKEYNSEAYLIHKAVPSGCYKFDIDCKIDTKQGDFIHAEIHQANGQSAWISPVYIK